MKKLLVITAIMMSVACTQEKKEELACKAEEAMTKTVATAVATELACTNQAAVEAYVKEQTAKLNLCKPAATEPAATEGTMSAQGALGNVVCGPLVDGLVAGLVGQIPADWACTGGVNAEKLKALLTTECQKAI